MAIIPIWQPVGFSTHQIAKKTGELSGEKGTHTGTLDPMAEGVIVALTGPDRLKKIELAGWKKTYEFEVLLGISTDSFDALGLIQEEKTQKLNVTGLQEKLPKFKGHYEQQVPIYSAIHHKGKKLFEYAQSGEKPDFLPTKKGEIYNIEYLGCETVSAIYAVKTILHKLKNIHGDFRQEKIIEQWEKYLEKLEPTRELEVIKILAETSRGLYVRSLSQDIISQIGQVGFVYSLKRVQNGKFTQKECKTLADIFGPGYDMLFWSDKNNLER